MQQTELIRQIIDSCDENLRDVFLRRMDAAVLIAKSKLENGEPVHNVQQEERVLRHVTAGLSPELSLRADSLWRNLTRMNRGRQYRYFIMNKPELQLIHEPDLQDSMPAGSILCPAEELELVRSAGFDMELIPCCDAKEDVIRRLLEGEGEYAALAVDGFYDTEWLYSMIYNKRLYINSLSPTPDGRMVVLMSRHIVNAPENSIISLAFSMRMDQPGDLAQTLSVMAEAKMNMEYLRVKTHNIADDDRLQINIVFAEMSAASLTATDVRAALLQLEQELPFFRVMGYRVSVSG